MWQIWLITAGFFFILEIVTTTFLVFWFSIAALITMIFSFFITNNFVLFSIFVISSTILLFATKPFVKKMTVKDNVKTNAFSIEGKKAKVLIDIDPVEGTGQIKVNGEKWSANSADESFIPKDSEVTILKIDGVKAIVEPLQK